jgi:4-aminobutyrate aminotransferase-like enzyme
MNTLIHADIFFFIASIGFVILIALSSVLLVYLIGIVRKVRSVSEKIGENVEGMSADAKEFVQDVRGSGIYRMLFPHKRAKKK